MKSIRLFDSCLFVGDTWQVIAQDGAKLALRSYTTNRVRHVSISELLGHDSFEPDEAPTLPDLKDVAILDTLTDAHRERTLELFRHVYEIEHGIPPIGLDGEPRLPRPEYAVSQRLSDRVAAKVDELSNTSRPL